MTIVKENINLRGMINVDYFEYEEEYTNPGTFIEIRYSELLNSELYRDIVKATRVFSSVNDGLNSVKGAFNFLKELNGLSSSSSNSINNDDKDIIISFRSSELLNDISIDTLNVHGIEDDFYSLLDNLLDTNKDKFNYVDIRKAFYMAKDLHLNFSLENLKAVEDTIKVFGKLLFNALDKLSKEYIEEELYK